ncbi:MAG: flavin reductase family protein [Gemmatimonadetes bacterium]|nr:flavin reductase family protein [Gemmatimonadota bacterium]
MVSEEKFRWVMGHFATGVTVVASRTPGGEAVGLTVNAFTSVSLDPPLVLVCLHKDAEGHDPILQAGHFGVSFLTGGQGNMALTFSQADPEDRFKDLSVKDGPLGSPLVDGALAWVDCKVMDVFPGGDHSIVVGQVEACDAGDGDPLMFFRGNLSGMGS